MITAVNLMELGLLGIGIIYMTGGGITGIGSNLPKDITFLNVNSKKELPMSIFEYVLLIPFVAVTLVIYWYFWKIYRPKIKLPIKNNNGNLFYLLINPILEEHNLLQDYSIVFFNEVFGKPELFEYIGNIDVVSKFATDTEYIKYLCGERKEFFNELVNSKNATLNTMIGVLLDNQAKAIGLVAFWDTSKTMMTTNGNLHIEFTELPVGVIYD